MDKTVKNREKLILAGLFLAKFDKEGLDKLGFSTFTEAFNVLGYALEGKPMNIKNYRDEFDPYYPNSRQGWHKREIRPYCKKVMDSKKNLNLDEFSKLINSFLSKDFEIKKEIDNLFNKKDNISEEQKSFTSRLATGLAAENYFIENYKRHFNNFSLTDTRFLGCGFDFKLSSKDNFFLVEVKGLHKKSGNFLITEKEYNVAQKTTNNFCLYIVKNFIEKPCEELYFNPLEKFNLIKQEQKIVITNYQGKIYSK